MRAASGDLTPPAAGGGARVEGAVITGPRTQEHLASQLGAADVRLSRDVLDRIDAIVTPGVTISAADEGYQPPSLTDASKRRRGAAGH
ncbi:hypothetical protein ACIREO_07495 [Streptomyces sp. NPDC102441]|uniref:hypothetical protein n=1 Tax=Streptomyces sp. NPDC102441 TaxID=3366176 RepID=UPI00380C6C28